MAVYTRQLEPKGERAKEGDGGNAPREVKDADGKSSASHSVKHGGHLGWRCLVRRPDE